MKRKLFLWIGNGLTVAGVMVLILPWGPALIKEIEYYWWQLVEDNNQVDVSLTDASADQFRVIIPKIKVDAEVIKNVDPFRPEIYLPALERGVAHASNTSLPGEPGNVFLFAHSTDAPWRISRYNAEFYLLNKLETGDQVLIIYQGKEYFYQIINKEVVSSTDTGRLQPQIAKSTLTMQTCWPPGTTWKRLLVTAELINKK